jgi:hypothetical protein
VLLSRERRRLRSDATDSRCARATEDHRACDGPHVAPASVDKEECAVARLLIQVCVGAGPRRRIALAAGSALAVTSRRAKNREPSDASEVGTKWEQQLVARGPSRLLVSLRERAYLQGFTGGNEVATPIELPPKE